MAQRNSSFDSSFTGLWEGSYQAADSPPTWHVWQWMKWGMRQTRKWTRSSSSSHHGLFRDTIRRASCLRSVLLSSDGRSLLYSNCIFFFKEHTKRTDQVFSVFPSCGLCEEKMHRFEWGVTLIMELESPIWAHSLNNFATLSHGVIWFIYLPLHSLSPV